VKDSSIYQNHQEQEELDVKQLLLKVWYYKFWFLSAVVLFLALGFLYLRYSQPTYSSSAKIFIRDNRSGGSVSEEMIFQDLGLFNSDKNVLNEIAILKSRDLMKEVVVALDLHFEWMKTGTVKTTEDYSKSIAQLDTTSVKGTFYFTPISEENFRLSKIEDEAGDTFSYGERIRWDDGFLTLSPAPSPNVQMNQQYILKIFTPESVASRYSNALQVKRESDWATLLNMKIETNVPKKSADILNQVIEIYTQRSLREKNEGYERTLGFIEERIRLLTDELGLVEQTIESFKKKNEIAGQAGEAVSELSSQMVEAETNKQRLEVQKEIIQQLEELLSDPEKPYQFLPGSLSPENERLTSLIERYNTFILKRNQFLVNAGPENPDVKSLEAEINKLKESIFDNIDRAYDEIDVTYEAADRRSQRLQREFTAIPKKERELLEIVRQQKIKESLYLYLLQKREEIALSISMATSNVRVVDWPVVSKSQVSPKPIQIYAIALSLGLTLPLGIVLLLQLFNTKVKSRDDIKELVSLPIVGEILQSSSAKDKLIGHGKTQAAEMFRLLRTNLSFLLPQKKSPHVLVTSFESGEGKTFVAANLALSLSLTGKKVCILGVDLRKTKLHTYFDTTSNQRGITSYIMGEVALPSIIHTAEEHPTLDYVLSGTIPPNPAELLLNDRFEELLRELEEQYDIIVWDSAPVGLVADTRSIKDLADATLFVVKQGYSQKKALTSLSDERSDYQLKNAAIVFNGIKEGSFYGYGRYSYGYGKYNKGYYQ
jgi:capsular exopolysaccharide synthesis family protein